MSKSTEIFWTEDRLRQMAINELLAHGGNSDDLIRLRQHFKKADENNQAQAPNIEIPG
jgi:hypothetical protein